MAPKQFKPAALDQISRIPSFPLKLERKLLNTFARYCVVVVFNGNSKRLLSSFFHSVQPTDSLFPYVTAALALSLQSNPVVFVAANAPQWKNQVKLNNSEEEEERRQKGGQFVAFLGCSFILYFGFFPLRLAYCYPDNDKGWGESEWKREGEKVKKKYKRNEGNQASGNDHVEARDWMLRIYTV